MNEPNERKLTNHDCLAHNHRAHAHCSFGTTSAASPSTSGSVVAAAGSGSAAAAASSSGSAAGSGSGAAGAIFSRLAVLGAAVRGTVSVRTPSWWVAAAASASASLGSSKRRFTWYLCPARSDLPETATAEPCTSTLRSAVRTPTHSTVIWYEGASSTGSGGSLALTLSCLDASFGTSSVSTPCSMVALLAAGSASFGKVSWRSKVPREFLAATRSLRPTTETSRSAGRTPGTATERP